MLLLTTTIYLLSHLAAAQYLSPSFANFTGDNGKEIDLGYTKVRGTRVASSSFPINAWLGIRYGKAPTGNGRFKAAAQIDEQSDSPASVFDATTFGPICYQAWTPSAPDSSLAKELYYHTGNREESEDCLLLDIYAPAEPTSKSIPVLLIIHGGGYDQGGSTSINPVGIMAAAPGQFMVVSIQYRLGAFGFLAGAEVAESGTLNAGLLDQRLAMQWVQRHISSFGGDPAQVTIDGGSAGGGSVYHQLLWNGGEADPPYRAAIVEYPWMPNMLNTSQLELQYRQVLTASKCINISCLRDLSAEEFNTAQQKVLASATYAFGTFYFGPTIDGINVQGLPSKETEAEHFATVPLMTTRDGNEGFAFTPQNITTEKEYNARVRTFLNGGVNFFGQLNRLYPSVEGGTFGYNNTQTKAEYLFGDWVIQCPTYNLARSFTDNFSKLDAVHQPVYKLIAGYPTYDSAYHGSYSSLVFSTKPIPAEDTSPNAEIGRVLQRYFTSFIITTDPNKHAKEKPNDRYVEWPQYGAASNILYINSPAPVQIQDIDAAARCDFLLSHSSATAN
ncbi:Alpha/Beta hydrolase protein [Trichoderma sp. SZMC 28015]